MMVEVRMNMGEIEDGDYAVNPVGEEELARNGASAAAPVIVPAGTTSQKLHHARVQWPAIAATPEENDLRAATIRGALQGLMEDGNRRFDELYNSTSHYKVRDAIIDEVNTMGNI